MGRLSPKALSYASAVWPPLSEVCFTRYRVGGKLVGIVAEVREKLRFGHDGRVFAERTTFQRQRWGKRQARQGRPQVDPGSFIWWRVIRFVHGIPLSYYSARFLTEHRSISKRTLSGRLLCQPRHPQTDVERSVIALVSCPRSIELTVKHHEDARRGRCHPPPNNNGLPRPTRELLPLLGIEVESRGPIGAFVVGERASNHEPR